VRRAPRCFDKIVAIFASTDINVHDVTFGMTVLPASSRVISSEKAVISRLATLLVELAPNLHW
jgi:hypothetical protein